MQDRITQLEAEVKMLKEGLSQTENTNFILGLQIDKKQLQAENKRLREALFDMCGNNPKDNPCKNIGRECCAHADICPLAKSALGKGGKNN